MVDFAQVVPGARQLHNGSFVHARNVLVTLARHYQERSVCTVFRRAYAEYHGAHVPSTVAERRIAEDLHELELRGELPTYVLRPYDRLCGAGAEHA